ncbi:MAG: glycosyltransferase family 4 protein [Anaerolineales bacterium]|nr:glycosyltransferase family 4 protein [Anaerolineales bacterium]
MKNAPSIDWLITQLKVVGGAERFVYWLACELFRRGWDLRVITIVDDDNLSNHLRHQGIPVLSLRVKSKADFQVWRKLEQIWREKKPDILHTHLYHAGILGRLVGKKVGIPIVLCHQGGPENNRPFYRTIIDFCTSPFTTRYVVPCKAVGSILHRRERIPLRKIDYIPNAISVPLEELYSNRVSRGEKFVTPVRLVSVGRLVFEKAQWVMVEAVNILAMRNLSTSLQIIGAGDLESDISSLIRRLNLAGSVCLLGYSENPFDWIKKSDIFLLTSLWESLSLALMEAMAFGLPVIATATGGTPELITHLETGYLIPPNSPMALADAIEYLINHPEVARQMGEKAQKHILDNYTIPKIADQLENYYLNLLEEKSSG